MELLLPLARLRPANVPYKTSWVFGPCCSIPLPIILPYLERKIPLALQTSTDLIAKSL